MPGPTRFRGPALMHVLTSNKVSEKTLNERVRKVLELVQLASRAGVPEYAPERKLNRPEDRALLRRAAGESVVLLKNDKNDRTNSPILPLDREKTTLVIGPNADLAAYCGGGSASLLAYYTVTPRQGIADKCGAEQVVFSQGCYGHKELPLLGEHLRTIETGQPGYTFRLYTEPPPASGSFKGSDSRTPVDELHMTNSSAFLMDYSHPQISGDTYYATLEGTFEPPESGVYEFGLTVAGTGLLYIDGVLVVDNKTVQRAGTSFFGIGTVEERGERYLEAGKKHHVFVEFGTAPTSNLQHHHGVVSFGPGGLRLGGCRKLDTDTAIQQAVQSAAQADQVVVCVGLSGDWESEGFDRPHMDLPPGTDELVNAVLAVQPNAVIVVQSGTPVTMPWADKAKALLQAWYGGNEAGNGIADVLFGDVNPVRICASPTLTSLGLLTENSHAPYTVRQTPPDLSPRTLAEPVLSQLPLRARTSPLQRGHLRGISILRHDRTAATLPIRPRAFVLNLPPEGPHHWRNSPVRSQHQRVLAPRERDCLQHQRTSGRRGRAGIRAATSCGLQRGTAGARAQRVREGHAAAGRNQGGLDHDSSWARDEFLGRGVRCMAE